MELVNIQKTFEKCETIEALNNALKNILLSEKITTYSFTYYSLHPKSNNKLRYDTCSKNFVKWHKYYLTESLQSIDSTMDEVYPQTLPIYWDLQTQLANASSEKERRMREDSILFGAERGLSIPLHGAQYDFAILLLVQMKKQHWMDDWQEKQFYFMLIGQLYFYFLQKIYIVPEGQQTYKFSKRELECLNLLAKQCTMSEISKRLTITERTVNYHIQNINRKLGTKNKHQSVTKALELKLLTL